MDSDNGDNNNNNNNNVVGYVLYYAVPHELHLLYDTVICSTTKTN